MTIKIPGDKSISHRALIIASMAQGVSEITGLSGAEDVQITYQALADLGVKIESQGDKVLVYGGNNYHSNKSTLFLGNSGTTCRLLIGLLSGKKLDMTLTGDQSLSARPMRRLLDILRDYGAKFQENQEDGLPLRVLSSKLIKPLNYRMHVPSAQIKSALLLAALDIEGVSEIIDPFQTRNHTELLLQYFGAAIEVDQAKVTIHGKKSFHGRAISVPKDPSSAAFFIALQILKNQGELILENILLNPTRIAFIDVMQQMGGEIIVKNTRISCGEVVGDIWVGGRAKLLRSVQLTAANSSKLIDEYPILAILAACANGISRFEGVGELRFKESDRIEAISCNLGKCGIKTNHGNDWLEIQGDSNLLLRTFAARIESFLDHRIAMSFWVLNEVAIADIAIDNPKIINTSFPYSELSNV